MSKLNRTNHDKIKKIASVLSLIIFLLTMAMLAECLLFQFHAITKRQPSLNFDLKNQSKNVGIEVKDGLAKLSEDEVKAIEVRQETERLIAEHNGETYVEELDEGIIKKDDILYREVKETIIDLKLDTSYYVREMQVKVPLEEKGGYQVTAYRSDKNLEIGPFYCTIDPRIDIGVSVINTMCDSLKITVLSGEEINTSKIEIGLSNVFAPNLLRVAFLFFAFGGIAWLIFEEKLTRDKPEWVFAICAFAIGTLLIWGIGTNQVSFDEHVHAKKAYDLSFGNAIETTESAMQMKGNLLPMFYNRTERNLVDNYLQENHDYSWADITYQSRFTRSEDRVYYPNAAGFYLGRVLGSDFSSMVALAKYGNLLIYIAIVFLAIKLAAAYKPVVVLIGLLPNNLFIGSAISYDGVVTAFLLLAAVYVTNELLTPEKRLEWYHLLGLLGAFVIGSLTKPVYIVMTLMVVFFGKKKFVNRGQEFIIKLCVCMVAALMIYGIFKPLPVAGGDYQLVSNAAFMGDKRNVGTSMSGQIQYIFGNPLEYTVLLLKSMFGMLSGYLFQGRGFAGYAYLGFSHWIWNWILLLTGVFAAVVSKHTGALRERLEVSAIGLKYIILNLIMILGTSAVIWTSMYVSYTAVGNDVIQGVQGRYFIPLFLPFLSCFFQRKREFKIDQLWINRLVFAVCGVLNLYMVYQFVLLAMNL